MNKESLNNIKLFFTNHGPLRLAVSLDRVKFETSSFKLFLFFYQYPENEVPINLCSRVFSPPPQPRFSGK